eukprot:355511-Pyramimonas_sp.AAC.1
MQAISNRVWRLGLTCPGEKALNRIVWLVVTASNDADILAVEPQTVLSWQKRVQSLIKSLDANKSWPCDHIVEYPSDPTGLPDAVSTFAYEEEPP